MGGRQALPNPRRRVLVADDDATIRAFLTDFLELQDCAVRTAPDGWTALTIFHAERFDVLLVDYQMPGLTGLEMATRVRKTDLHTPIALITGNASALDIEAVVQTGVSRMFSKPVNLEELSTWIRSCPLALSPP